MKGFITIHRQLIESAVYKDSHAVHLWLHLLLKANHKKNDFVMNGKLIIVERGQILTGRKVLSAETGIQESKIQRLLKLFENMQMIEQHTNNRNRLITVVSYDKYQAGEQQVNNTRTTGEQLVNTNNNVNNDNNVNNKPTVDKSPEWMSEYLDAFWNSYLKKVDKKKTITLLTKMIIKKPDVEHWQMVLNHIQQKAVITEKQFWPAATRFLRDELWTDELPTIGESNGQHKQPNQQSSKPSAAERVRARAEAKRAERRTTGSSVGGFGSDIREWPDNPIRGGDAGSMGNIIEGSFTEGDMGRVGNLKD